MIYMIASMKVSKYIHLLLVALPTSCSLTAFSFSAQSTEELVPYVTAATIQKEPFNNCTFLVSLHERN